jgi:hypothetical protein
LSAENFNRSLVVAKSAKEKAKSKPKAAAKSKEREPVVKAAKGTAAKGAAAKSAAAKSAKHPMPGKDAPFPKQGKQGKEPGQNEAQIAVHWKEEDLFFPSEKFIAQANLNDPAFVAQFDEANFPE